VRWLIRDDPAKTASMDALMTSERHLVVPDATLIEVIYVLESYYNLSRDHVAQAIRLMIGQAALDINRTQWTDIVDTYLTHPKLSCTDIYLALDAKRNHREPVYSFDKKSITQLGAVSP